MSAQPSNMPEVTLPATALEAVDPPEIDPKTLQERICKAIGRFVKTSSPAAGTDSA